MKYLALILLFVLAPFAYAATDIKNDDTLATNLVSHWKLEEASGTREDIHSTNDLTDNNTVLSATGKIDTAADFERTNSEDLSITDAAQSGLDLAGSMSISAWVQFETDISATFQEIVAKYTTGTNRNYLLEAGSDGNELIFLQVANGSTVSNVCEKAWTPTTGTFYHVAATFDNTADEMKLYVDGAQLGTTCTGQSGTPDVGTAPFTIGSRSTSGGQYFDGVIDEVSIWSRAITGAEVIELYNSGAGIPYEAAAEEPSEATTTPFIRIQDNVTFEGNVIIRP